MIRDRQKFVTLFVIITFSLIILSNVYGIQSLILFTIRKIVLLMEHFWLYLLSQHVWKYFWQYFPLTMIGLWRWSSWVVKKICSLFYKPIVVTENHPCAATLCIIAPVYNEKPELFTQALLSWYANEPNELIAVIDQRDKDCVYIFEQFARDKPMAKLIVTSKPGKRPALVDGILKSKSGIVALVDSDVVWAPNIKNKLLVPFKDPKIGGVTARQNSLESKTIWQKMANIQWNQRNYLDWPSQAAMGNSLSCLSGRTALYRRHILLPKLNEFLNEIILGKKKESGEDKCLTRLIQKDGWKTYYQSNAQVFTEASPNFKTFINQKVRWSRNTFNSDLLSLSQGWIWKRPYLTFFTVDKLVSVFTIFIGPIAFGGALYLDKMTLAISILILWLVGRGIKLSPHLRNHPKDIFILPAYIGINFMLALVRLYALVTLREQKWIRSTVRYNKRFGLFKKIGHWIITGNIIMGIIFLVVTHVL